MYMSWVLMILRAGVSSALSHECAINLLFLSSSSIKQSIDIGC